MEYLHLDFFFGLVDVDSVVAVLASDTFPADLGLFEAGFKAVVDLDPFVLTCCRACWAFIAKNSCLLEHPVFSKIRLMVGEVSSSSSMASREEAWDPWLVVAFLTDEGQDGRAVSEREEPMVLVADEWGACFKFEFDGRAVRTFFLVTYGLSTTRDFRVDGSFSLFLWSK